MIVAARFIAERLGQVRSFNAWYRIGDLRPGIEASLFPPVVAEPDARRREAAAKADRRRYRLATHGAHVFDTVRFLLGEVASLVARHRGHDRDHVWQLLVTTAAGAVGTATVRRAFDDAGVAIPSVSATFNLIHPDPGLRAPRPRRRSG